MSTSRQQTLLDHYEAIAHASQRMLQAARRGDWNALLDAEAHCASLIERLQAAGDPAAILDADGRKRKHEIIRRLLADDAQIRDLTQPWLRQLAARLGRANGARALAKSARP